MTNLEVLDMNIEAGTIAFRQLEAKMRVLRDAADEEPDVAMRAVLFAEVCGMVYGLLFLKSEIMYMRSCREQLVEDGVGDEVAPQAEDYGGIDIKMLDDKLRGMME